MINNILKHTMRDVNLYMLYGIINLIISFNRFICVSKCFSSDFYYTVVLFMFYL